MKKFIVAAIALIMIAAVFAGCSDGLEEQRAAANTDATSATEAVTEEKKTADYKDNYVGLCNYMQDKGYIKIKEKSADEDRMNAELIGAEEGNRYTMNTVTIELYAFDLKSDNKTRDEVIASVKKDGKFTIYNKEVTAYLSDNSKYLMIYSDTAIGTDDTTSDAYKTQQEAVKDFKAFKK